MKDISGVEIKLFPNERVDRVNDDLMLIQRTDGLTFGTDALLLAGYIDTRGGRALEIGGGTGIISLLTLTRGRFDTVDCCEIQSVFADIIRRNAELNRLDARLFAKEADIRTFEAERQYDAVFTNPPYMTVSSGKKNSVDEKNTARHEVEGGIADFCRAAKRLLRYGGKFYAVYRPDRVGDLIFAMKDADIEPKRLTFVHADLAAEPSVVLVEGRMSGGVGARVTRPLIIYTDSSHKNMSADMEYIMNNGSFPEDFYIGNKRQKK